MAAAVAQDTYSVMTKSKTPPSGSKHDYLSQAPYWWYDPAKPGGIPYIRLDGEHNPEVDKITDRANLDRMIDEVVKLAEAGDDESNKRAGLLLRTWFLDPATQMNPNLKFAQYVTGVNDGQSTGIIETAGFTRLIPAIEKLKESKAWTHRNRLDLEVWFSQYLLWLRESPNGKEEAAAKNNHGSWYDAQVAAIALFTGQKELAQRVISEVRVKRIARQIQPGGEQPLELARTKAFSYSVFNLEALCTLASLGDQVGTDLWNYKTSDGRSLKRAIRWLIPYATGAKKWEYDQIVPPNMDSYRQMLLKTAEIYHDLSFKAAAEHIATWPDSDSK